MIGNGFGLWLRYARGGGGGGYVWGTLLSVGVRRGGDGHLHFLSSREM